MLEFWLLIAGMFLGIWWFSVIVLPLIYAFPRSLYWSVRRWAKWRAPFLYFLPPLIWTVTFFGIALILVVYFPNIASYLLKSDGFNAGQLVGIALSVLRAIFSKSTRLDMTRDFYDFMKPYLTKEGKTGYQAMLQKMR